jgi:hypothetical protein
VKIQTVIAFDAHGTVVDACDIYVGKRNRMTPRRIKKEMKARADVARVQRITTIENYACNS